MTMSCCAIVELSGFAIVANLTGISLGDNAPFISFRVLFVLIRRRIFVPIQGTCGHYRRERLPVPIRFAKQLAMTSKATMRALQVERLSTDLSGVVLGEVPVPVPAKGEVLVEIDAASLNFPDLLMTRGEYQLKPDLPFTLGGDFSGTVLALGEGVGGFATGDRVWGFARGSFAQKASVLAATLGPLPQALDRATGAAFGAAYLTAYVALVERARVRAGEWVLVHGAAGGMGLAAVDLARALGARVIATSSSDEKLAEIGRLYPSVHLVNNRDGFRDRVLELTGGNGAEVIFDPVNGAVFDESVRSIAFDGRLLVIGFTSGEYRPLRSNIAMIKAFSLMGVRAGEYGRRFPDRRARVLGELARMASEGAIRPHVDSQYLLEDWGAAFERMQDRSAVGKIVLLP